jgi:glutamate dehydrogenase
LTLPQDHPPANGELRRAFSQALIARVPHDGFARLPPSERDEISEEALNFFATRDAPIKLRLFSRANGDETITVVESAMPDRPFIIDTFREYLHELRAPIRLLLHPIFSVVRDHAGNLLSLDAASSLAKRESLIHAELELAPSPERASEIKAELQARLGEVLVATGDFEAMKSRALKLCEEIASERELVEIRDLLRWLVDDRFVFLGYRRYLITHGETTLLAVDSGRGLGLMRDDSRSRYASPQPLDRITPQQRRLIFEGPVLVAGKTRARSRVHRAAAMDDFVIRRANGRGQPVALDRFIGLFTAKALAEEAQHIPVLRAKLRELQSSETALPGSHDFRELESTFNSFPKEELFRASVAELRVQLEQILDVTRENEVRLTILSDPNRESVVAMVLMPRERMSDEVRVEIQDLLARKLPGELLYFHVARREGYVAMLHYCFHAPAQPAEATAELQAEVSRLARGWDDRLEEALAAIYRENDARALALRYARAFSADYKARHPIDRAVADIGRVESILAGSFASTVELAHGSSESELRFYELGAPLLLSDVMPMLANFGLRVLSEQSDEIRVRSGGISHTVFTQAFNVQGPKGQPLTALEGAKLMADAIAAVRAGRAEDDQLNSLTLSAGLDWRAVALVRGLLAIAFQMKLAPGRPGLRRVAVNYPPLARLMVELFCARLDPDKPELEAQASRLRDEYLDTLDAIENIADDRAARSMLSLVEAAVRTNFFCPLPFPDPYVAIKFESRRIVNLPDTPPLYEIHVNSPRMEGCHLRAGKVARGGIRYSDRPDDFRTEILDLMKTQTVKNAIIVPLGAKGGFVVKPRAGATASRQEVVEAYRTLINALLDVTDNLVEGDLVHPDHLRIIDEDGPYLVVAADKGTAAFSDIANEIAQARGFWLGDAFASGGRHGYDHKALGITARGAWDSALRHLHEMGRTPDHGEPITIAGIGDMSGDVFGNGLLRSANVKLIAAFDHRHIFLDPNPNPAVSFAERKRLFETPNSQWSDYRPALLSRGGAVFARGRKRIVISQEARAALGCEAHEFDGESLVRAVLQAPVDLLYNGGIGTYVRGNTEADSDIGDHANDACRISAAELRAKIAIEGGNLGFTQRARIDYALMGGRINTDAIDNSAGVDMSDHEVNLKILLQPLLRNGSLTVSRRNRVLEDAVSEVVAQVLADNREQALMLTLEQARSRDRQAILLELIASLEARELLRRQSESLPTLQSLSERHPRFAGLTRPELALISAYTKIDLVRRIEAKPMIEDPYLAERYLRAYFPPSIARQFADQIPRHPLRRELIATMLINRLVNLVGATFVISLTSETGADEVSAVRAYAIASDLLELELRAARYGTSELSADAETSALLSLERAATLVCRRLIGDRGESMADTVARYKPPLLSIFPAFESYLAGAERERFERTYRDLKAAGQREEVAHDLARLAFADHLIDVIALAISTGANHAAVAARYFELNRDLDLGLLDSALDAIVASDRWEQRAARELASELRASRLRLVQAGGVANTSLAELSAVRDLIGEFRSLPSISLAAIQIAARAISRLIPA